MKKGGEKKVKETETGKEREGEELERDRDDR